jgi:hypothetical protein
LISRVGAINYDSNDKYSINGQRLILISGNEYRYEIDQWSKIVASGSDAANPDYWIEYLPDGTVRKYGSTSVRIHSYPTHLSLNRLLGF